MAKEGKGELVGEEEEAARGSLSPSLSYFIFIKECIYLGLGLAPVRFKFK